MKFLRFVCIFLFTSIACYAKVSEIKSESFDKEIASGKVLVDFYATWCGPCKRLSPVLDQLSDEMGKVDFVKINIDNARQLSEKYEVTALPTLILFENGQEKGRIEGFRDKSALKNFIETGKK